jgi:3-dehydroquinate dehydratase-1
MKNIVQVRDIELGDGIPKIAVPFMGSSDKDIIEEILYLKTINMDLAEWRIDYYEDVYDIQKMKRVLAEARKVLGNIPLIFTFRTEREGGKKKITIKYYEELIKTAAATGNIDIADVELSIGDTGLVRKIVNDLHQYGVKVIISSHDFKRTPTKNELVYKMCKMQQLGADLPKVAVMPHSAKDVLALLSSTDEMACYHNETPVIAISMGPLGVITRISGEIFGSAVTFGSAKATSAPGQLESNMLYKILRCITYK